MRPYSWTTGEAIKIIPICTDKKLAKACLHHIPMVIVKARVV